MRTIWDDGAGMQRSRRTQTDACVSLSVLAVEPGHALDRARHDIRVPTSYHRRRPPPPPSNSLRLDVYSRLGLREGGHMPWHVAACGHVTHMHTQQLPASWCTRKAERTRRLACLSQERYVGGPS